MDGSGRMSSTVFQQKLEAKRDAIVNCYQTALVVDPAVAGDLTLVVTINQQGSVSVAVERMSAVLNTSGVTSCVLSVMRGLNFTSSPPEGGDFSVRVPLTFSLSCSCPEGMTCTATGACRGRI